MQMGSLDSPMQPLEMDNNLMEWQEFYPRHILRYPELFPGIPTSFMLFVSIFCLFVVLGGFVAYIKTLDYTTLNRDTSPRVCHN